MEYQELRKHTSRLIEDTRVCQRALNASLNEMDNLIDQLKEDSQKIVLRLSERVFGDPELLARLSSEGFPEVLKRYQSEETKDGEKLAAARAYLADLDVELLHRNEWVCQAQRAHKSAEAQILKFKLYEAEKEVIQFLTPITLYIDSCHPRAGLHYTGVVLFLAEEVIPLAEGRWSTRMRLRGRIAWAYARYKRRMSREEAAVELVSKVKSVRKKFMRETRTDFYTRIYELAEMQKLSDAATLDAKHLSRDLDEARDEIKSAIKKKEAAEALLSSTDLARDRASRIVKAMAKSLMSDKGIEVLAQIQGGSPEKEGSGSFLALEAIQSARKHMQWCYDQIEAFKKDLMKNWDEMAVFYGNPKKTLEKVRGFPFNNLDKHARMVMAEMTDQGDQLLDAARLLHQSRDSEAASSLLERAKSHARPLNQKIVVVPRFNRPAKSSFY